MKRWREKKLPEKMGSWPQPDPEAMKAFDDLNDEIQDAVSHLRASPPAGNAYSQTDALTSSEMFKSIGTISSGHTHTGGGTGGGTGGASLSGSAVYTIPPYTSTSPPYTSTSGGYEPVESYLREQNIDLQTKLILEQEKLKAAITIIAEMSKSGVTLELAEKEQMCSDFVKMADKLLEDVADRERARQSANRSVNQKFQIAYERGQVGSNWTASDLNAMYRANSIQGIGT